MKTFFSLIVLILALSVAQSPLAFDVKTVTINASKMKASFPATVVLPNSYKVVNKHYPVVYLLHGYGGNFQDWVGSSDVESFADSHQLIIVMPDGNTGSWYLNSPVKQNSNFETYIYKDVVGFIDKNYRTIQKKDARAISGLSMGGFGALNTAINHNTVFGAVGSLSGGVDPRPFEGNWELTSVFGTQSKNKAFWDSRAIINNAQRLLLSDLDVYLDCGVDDFFIESNRALRQKLLELNIPHDYSERPGGHTWDYWRRAINYQMQFFADGFDHKLKR